MQTTGRPALDFHFQPEVVGQAHRPGRVVLHGRDAAVGGARPDGDDGRGLVGEAVDPLVGGDGLAVLGVDPEAGPVALAVDLLVADRALDDEDERVELALLGVVPGLDVLVADLVRDDLVVDHHARHAGDDALDDVLEAGVGGRGHGHRVALAGESRGHPQDVRSDLLGLLLARNELDCACHRYSFLADQQIRGSGSPTSWSMTRLPPNAVCTSTIPGGSVFTSPISTAPSQPGHRAQRRQRRVRRLGRHEGDELALVGHVHRVDAEDLRGAGHRRLHRHVALAHDHRHARGARQLVEHRGDAAARRVAHAAQLRSGRVEQRVDGRPQRAACRTRPRRRARTRRGRA